jgi:purine-nucleoside phosphorylase
VTAERTPEGPVPAAEEGDVGAERVARAAAHLRAAAPSPPRVGLILGSGLGGLAEALAAPRAIRYSDVPGFRRPAVEGHSGRVVFGLLEGVSCVVLQGRQHAYEGGTAAELVLPVRALARLGIRALILTNAAGAINRTFRGGDVMLITDHINLMWRSPLAGPVLPDEHRFPDMSSPYDPALRRIAEEVALERGIRLVQGTYVAVLGPSYETPAEIRMLARLGADAVGMSTVPETITARAAGVPVLGLSVITNAAAGQSSEEVSHADVMAMGAAASPVVERLLRGIVPRIPA